jgi:hypothetical protein
MRLRCALAFAVVVLSSASCASIGTENVGGRYEPYTYHSCNGWMWVVAILPAADLSVLRQLADATPNTRHLPSYAAEVWYLAPGGEVQLCRADNVPHRACAYEFWEFRRGSAGWEVVNRGDWDCKVDQPLVTGSPPHNKSLERTRDR